MMKLGAGDCAMRRNGALTRKEIVLMSPYRAQCVRTLHAVQEGSAGESQLLEGVIIEELGSEEMDDHDDDRGWEERRVGSHMISVV